MSKIYFKSSKFRKYLIQQQKTSELVNSFECLVPYTVLIYKDILQFILLKKSFTQIYFHLKSILQLYDCHILFFVILFGIKQLNKLWKKTFLILFTNCHVSWDTLYYLPKATVTIFYFCCVTAKFAKF